MGQNLPQAPKYIVPTTVSWLLSGVRKEIESKGDVEAAREIAQQLLETLNDLQSDHLETRR